MEVFRRARAGFGGPEWERGLEILGGLRERVSGRALAEQLAHIATRAAG